MQQAYDVMGITSGSQLVASAEKVDLRRLQQSRRQVEASTKEARRARKVHSENTQYMTMALH